MLTSEMVKTFSKEQLVEEYLLIKEQEDKLKKDKEILAALIKVKLENHEVLEKDGSRLVLQPSKTYKYDDETAIVDYLKKKRLNNFIKVCVNAPALNKELKTKSALAESLKEYYHEEIVNKICINKNNEECE